MGKKDKKNPPIAWTVSQEHLTRSIQRKTVHQRDTTAIWPATNASQMPPDLPRGRHSARKHHCSEIVNPHHCLTGPGDADCANYQQNAEAEVWWDKAWCGVDALGWNGQPQQPWHLAPCGSSGSVLCPWRRKGSWELSPDSVYIHRQVPASSPRLRHVPQRGLWMPSQTLVTMIWNSFVWTVLLTFCSDPLKRIGLVYITGTICKYENIYQVSHILLKTLK